jgi:hypothetical protein
MAGASYPGAMRASDDDRRRVQSVLNDAFAEGRLTQQEWEQRTGELSGAATYAELDRLTADLPAAHPGPQYGSAQLSRAQAGPVLAAGQPVTNRMAVASLACGIGQLVAGFPAGVAAIILGHLAQRRIRETGEQGYGLARAGLIIGYVGTIGLLLLALLIVAGLAASSGHGVAPSHG